MTTARDPQPRPTLPPRKAPAREAERRPFRDNPRLDFTRIKAEPDVHFTHAGGFVAKTTATDPARLRALLERARV